jgi:hypothetical protein
VRTGERLEPSPRRRAKVLPFPVSRRTRRLSWWMRALMLVRHGRDVGLGAWG